MLYFLWVGFPASFNCLWDLFYCSGQNGIWINEVSLNLYVMSEYFYRFIYHTPVDNTPGPCLSFYGCQTACRLFKHVIHKCPPDSVSFSFVPILNDQTWSFALLLYILLSKHVHGPSLPTAYPLLCFHKTIVNSFRKNMLL